MGLFDGKSKMSNVVIKTPRDIFIDLLKTSSGTAFTRDVKFDIFYQIIAFQGAVDGVGCSTIVANTALALARLGLNVCVIDTSFRAPCQDILLKTNFRNVEKKDRVDWMDMYRSSKNVLNISKLDSKIGVLSFQDRTVIDLLSSNDNTEMVTLALEQLHSKFDMILIDVSQEPSAVATACLQECHKLIQIWSDAPHVLDNVKPYVINNTILSVPMDKMRNVVTSKTVDDIPVDWDSIMKQYGFNHLAHVGLSLDIARIIATGEQPFNYPSKSEDVQEFNDCIADIVCNLLNITTDEEKDKPKGTISSNDIADGKVEGTLTKKLKERDEELPEIYTTLEEADDSLYGVKRVHAPEVEYDRNDNTQDSVTVDEYAEHMNEENTDVFENDTIEDEGTAKKSKKRKLFRKSKK